MKSPGHLDKKKWRRAEKQWKKYKLQVFNEIVKDRMINYQRAVKAAKVQYFSSLIISILMIRKLYLVLNKYINTQIPLQQLVTFAIFTGKIKTIRASVNSTDLYPLEFTHCLAYFSHFKRLSLFLIL